MIPVVAPSRALLGVNQVVQFSAAVNGTDVTQPLWMVNGVPGGNSTVGTVSSNGSYTSPAVLPGQPVNVSVKDQTGGGTSAASVVFFFDPGNFTAGTVSATMHPLVALYSFIAPEGATVQVRFGTTTGYGLETWAQPAPGNGGAVNIFVAGMRASTTYHMQAMAHLVDGTRIADADHIFTTGALPASLLSAITAQQTGDLTPAAGVEMLCLNPIDGGNELTAVVTDLSGNVIWYADLGPGEWPYPMKLLPNGDVLVVATPATNSQGPTVAGSEEINEVREIDLTGDVVNRITLDQLNSGLAAIGAGFQAQAFHHDILKLPNGHLMLLVNYPKTFNNLAGQPPGTSVLGDALVDWDPQQGPVWTWSAFDHLDVNHAPYGVTDWTHANGLVYSADDGDLLLSMRNQNWIVKINYGDGAGDGSILWKFGIGGDFTLPAGQDPIEWNYGQHYPSIVSPNSAGVFDLMFFNNGNDRLVDAEDTLCSSPNVPVCYSSVPIFQVNEYTKTAQVLWEDDLTPAYSICCGNASILANGDAEFDVAFNLFTPGLSYVQEVTEEATPQLVWQMNIQGPLAYRAFRIPSLYPGIEWTQAAVAAAEAGASRPREPQRAARRKP